MIKIIDGFSPHIDQVRASALEAGFGTWLPNKGEVGSSIYDGMGFWGDHSLMHWALSCHVGQPIYPRNSFFRITTPETEAAYIHSDRESGQWTCVAYLSQHEETYGTGFYKHRLSGLREMPSFNTLRSDPDAFERLKRDMVKGASEDWDLLDNIAGAYNRAIIFSAPLFHARHPRGGLGLDPTTARMVWVCHFFTEIGV